ncbi:hypothetical protein K491DRAFT_757396 [Lophiostoma macrostomum CBS 122681]|uniref:C2H2-type domain-containing protein n=1 Tax=Lophiostoma macrostomum CBS 122681 TaxID=1314788 RepID=A0A6A6T9C0_9PLEO|nr:hypothetical protein K491DRAFT_757396 [Lophiostoma macrostomum CBS 122681]
MPRAEVGSNKYLANKMKSKGLQRLRWYCQACEKQCRDANGFKCHVQSESHVRQMQLVGEDPKKYIAGFSTDFQNDFVRLLRVAHGEKYIGANRFYNEYIRDKEHIHMNSTKWNSLTEFVKHLSREGIVNFKEDEKDGLMIAWRDTSMAATKRREEIRALEDAEAKNGAGEDRMLKRMAQRAKQEAEAKAKVVEARKAAEAETAAQSTSESPPQQTSNATASSDKATQPQSEAPPVKAPPVKISFGLKAKTAASNKAGLGQMKSQSVFKRMRADGEEKPGKKVKL